MFKKLFGGKTHDDSSTSGSAAATTGEFGATAPGTSIRYDGHLISKFKGDHQQLLKTYSDIAEAYGRGDFAAVQRLLQSFNDALRAHLLDENLRFYIYMQHVMNGDPENEQIIRDFRSEMSEIGKTVYEFLSTYSKEPLAGERITRFKAELDAIGPVLIRRIEAEEHHLYPLYQPPEVYGHR